VWLSTDARRLWHGRSVLDAGHESAGLGQCRLSAVFAIMLIGSLAIIPLPYLAAYVRILRYMYSKAEDLSELVSNVTSDTEFWRHMEPAEYVVSNGWTAWHPRGDDWCTNELWSDIVPVAYFRKGTENSLVIPIDWEHFLAWNIPPVCFVPGQCLPFHGPDTSTFTIKRVSRLIGRQHWSVVRADLNI
jgi:hypothetical protein